MNRKTVIIKKYGNRRLYDTTNSAYINQDEVAQMVQEGHNVQVVDAATGEDLTRLVLTQIIVQHAKEPGSAFPLDILRQMVVACGKVTQGTTLKYMKALLDMYQNAYRAMAPPMNPFELIQTQTAPLPASSRAPWGSQPTGGSYRAGRLPQNGDETVGIGELKQRIEELETLVSVRGAGKTARKRKGKSRRTG
jgi:polyhydroxyalkanoate synthesis repressor PhaR